MEQCRHLDLKKKIIVGTLNILEGTWDSVYVYIRYDT